MIDCRNIVKRCFWSVVAVVASAVLALPAVAQEHHHFSTGDEGPRVLTEWGVGVGASYTMLESSSVFVDLNPRFGIGGHLHMGLLFGSNFALEAEIHYSCGSVVASLPRVDLSRKIKTATVDFPVMFSARMLDSIIQLDAGVLFSVMSRAEYTYQNEVMFFGPVYPTFNLTFGAGVRLARHFLLEAHYVYPLGQTNNQFISKENTFTTRASRITAGLTLMF